MDISACAIYLDWWCVSRSTLHRVPVITVGLSKPGDGVCMFLDDCAGNSGQLIAPAPLRLHCPRRCWSGACVMYIGCRAGRNQTVATNHFFAADCTPHQTDSVLYLLVSSSHTIEGMSVFDSVLGRLIAMCCWRKSGIPQLTTAAGSNLGGWSGT